GNREEIEMHKEERDKSSTTKKGRIEEVESGVQETVAGKVIEKEETPIVDWKPDNIDNTEREKKDTGQKEYKPFNNVQQENDKKEIPDVQELTMVQKQQM
ncbi:hypothetical protein HAX54_009576, partial [Datura stramonium]|nr:hypothetical protein [Datura stramonium]